MCIVVVVFVELFIKILNNKIIQEVVDTIHYNIFHFALRHSISS
jgi:hypothetical protein